MSFRDLIDDVDATVRQELTEPAIFRPGGDADDVDVDVVLTFPECADPLARVNVVSSHPVAEFLVAQVPSPRGGSILCPVDVAADGARTVNACTRVYAITSQPVASGEGTWWIAETSKGQPLS